MMMGEVHDSQTSLDAIVPSSGSIENVDYLCQRRYVVLRAQPGLSEGRSSATLIN